MTRDVGFNKRNETLQKQIITQKMVISFVDFI